MAKLTETSVEYVPPSIHQSIIKLGYKLLSFSCGFPISYLSFPSMENKILFQLTSIERDLILLWIHFLFNRREDVHYWWHGIVAINRIDPSSWKIFMNISSLAEIFNKGQKIDCLFEKTCNATKTRAHQFHQTRRKSSCQENVYQTTKALSLLWSSSVS